MIIALLGLAGTLTTAGCEHFMARDDLLRNLAPPTIRESCPDANASPALSAHHRALMLWNEARYSEAMLVSSSALELSSDSNLQQASLRLQGDAHFFLGARVMAEASYRAALDLDGVAARYRAHGYKDLGVLLRDQGRYLEALRAFEEAKHLADTQADEALNLSLRGNLGSTFRQLGLRELARSEYQLQLDLARQAEAWPQAFDALLRLAYLYLEGQHPETAAIELAQAIDLSDRVAQPLQTSWLYQGLAHARYLMRDYRGALEAIDHTLASEAKIGDSWRLANSHAERGEILLALGDLPAARHAFKQSVELAAERSIAWRGRAGLAELQLLAGDWPKALQTYQTATTGITPGALREPWMYRSAREVAARAISLLALTDSAAEALELAERIKRSYRPDVVQQQGAAQIDQRLAQIELQLTQLGAAMAGIDELQAREPLRKIQQRLLARQSALLGSLGDRPPVGDPWFFSVPELQQALPPRSALVAYSLSEAGSVVFLLTADQLRVLPVALPIADLRHLAQSHLDLLSGTTDHWKITARQLYDALVSPLEPWLDDSVANWIVVGDPALAQLPFDTLIDAGEQLLLERFSISYAASAEQYLHSRTTPHPGASSQRSVLFASGSQTRSFAAGSSLERALAFDDIGRPAGLPAIPAVAAEVGAVGALMLAPEMFIDAVANEANLRAVLGTPAGLLHIASHAVANYRYPSRSAIVLAVDQSGHEDGLLTLAEILRLPLTADLVVLSACETRVQPSLHSTSPFSLADGLLGAGARSVIGSLWKVDDAATSDFMQRLYSNLARGLGRAQALRQAKLELAPLQHPRIWASFSLIGDPEPGLAAIRPGATDDQTSARNIAALAGLVVLLSVVALLLASRWRRKNRRGHRKTGRV